MNDEDRTEKKKKKEKMKKEETKKNAKVSLHMPQSCSEGSDHLQSRSVFSPNTKKKNEKNKKKKKKNIKKWIKRFTQPPS
jgi:hypothetical protein